MNNHGQIKFKILYFFIILLFFVFVRFASATPCPPEAAIDTKTMACRVSTFCDEHGEWYPDGWFHAPSRIASCSALRCIVTGGTYYGENYFGEKIQCNNKDGCQRINDSGQFSEQCNCPEGLKFSSCFGCVAQQTEEGIPAYYLEKSVCRADEISSWQEIGSEFTCGRTTVNRAVIKIASGRDDVKMMIFTGSSGKYHTAESIDLPKFSIKDIEIDTVNSGVVIPLVDKTVFCFGREDIGFTNIGIGGGGNCRAFIIKDSKTCKIDELGNYTETKDGSTRTTASCSYYCTDDTPTLSVSFWDAAAWKDFSKENFNSGRKDSADLDNKDNNIEGETKTEQVPVKKDNKIIKAVGLIAGIELMVVLYILYLILRRRSF